MAYILQTLGALSTVFTLTLPRFVLGQNVSSQGTYLDAPSPWDSGFAPDVVIDLSKAIPSRVAAIEGPLIADLETAANGTEHEGDGQFIGWGIDRRSVGDFYLRIMPLGASITQGVASSNGNGYRKHIRDQLRYAGWQVNMVGSKQDGTMADKDNEGWPGYVITGVHDKFAQSKSMMPNLVLLNVGTNDCLQNIDTANAGSRLKVLIDDIYGSIPGVTVIISTVLPNRNTADNPCTATVSAQYKSLYENYKSAGERVGFADMQSAITLNEIGPDGTHPTDAGYMLMASVWWDAFQKVVENLQAPDANAMNDATQTMTTTCAKVAGTARGPIKTQQGSGYDDGNYVHKSTAHGIVQTVAKGSDAAINDAIPAHIFFAQLVNTGGVDRSAALDEMIRIYHDQNAVNTYYFRLNNGGGSFNSPVTFDVDQNCDLGPTYWFADFNNDGLDDFWCIGADSQINLSLNRGGNPPKFEYIGEVVPPHTGYVATDVRIADIDGDGRADYCLVAAGGDILCSRNGGQGDSYYWQGFSTPDGLRGVVFTGKNKGDAAGVHFGDINGDFRSDWLYVGDTGDVDTYINQRGWGSGIVPNWVHAGITHPGQAVPGVRGLIKFGRIYGSGRLDYIYLKEEDASYDAYVWENIGAGGTKVKGDGVFYCDMKGTGSDDYVWVYNDGHTAEIYENIHSPPNWKHGPTNLFTVPGPRVGIHIADWDGDGKCDILVQNKATGALTMWRNDYNAITDTFAFTDVGVVSGSATCTQGWGVGIFDRGLRLADIDGDGRSDYLCIEPNGRVTGWLNPITGLTNVGQVKFSEGWDRSNMRFTDVENSGRHDLIHLDKYTGAGTVFKNMGPTPVSGSAFTWQNRGVLYAPIDRGETMHFANFGGLGRADLHHVLPISNQAWTYFNECGSSSGGDDGANADPGLPAYTSPDDGTGNGSGNGDGGGSDTSGDDTSDGDGDQTADYTPSCKFASHYPTLDALEQDLPNIPTYCAPIYALPILRSMLGEALTNYTKDTNGYSDKFKAYVKYVKEIIPVQLDAFMDWDSNGPGNKYFNCIYELSGKNGSKTSCPTPGVDWNENRDFFVYYELTDSDGFYAELLSTYGITQDWVTFGEVDTESDCYGVDGCLPDLKVQYGYPKKADDITVPDPSDVFEKGLAGFQALLTTISAAQAQMMLGWWGGSNNDVAEIAVMPVSMAYQAAKGMEEVIVIGGEVEAAEKKKLILEILSIVFLVVPFIGEGLGDIAAIATTFGRMIDLVGAAGNAALAVYGIVDDPNSAPLQILGILMDSAGGFGRSSKDMKNMAALRREMKDEDLAKIGSEFVANDASIQKIAKFCSI